jgi:3-(3-hydroxy-phenyl)propionate hydroxylase
VFLAGDAAHLSPPFAGQGMNSGIRDAHNLAWKLGAVRRGELGPRLLETYQAERAPHARALIDMAVTLGRIMTPRSRLEAWCVQSAFRLARLVPPAHAYLAQMKYKPKPHYREGFLSDPAGTRLAGRMLPQPRLELEDGRTVRLDDLAGSRCAYIACGASSQRTLGLLATAAPAAPDLPRVAILPRHVNLDRTDRRCIAGRDVDGTMGSIGTPHDVLLILRPDRYVATAGAAARPEDVAALVHQFESLRAETWLAARTRLE